MIKFDVIAICIAFMFIGPALILVNQYILKGLNFPYPMFLSGLGVLASALTAQVLVRLGYVQLQRKEAIEGMLWYKRVLPVGFTHACTLAFGNTVYLYMNVGFIQMLKSFTPVILMITGYVANIDIPTMPVIYSVVVISLGTAATCSFSPEFSIIGITIMFLAELTEGIRLIFTQFFLQQLKFGVVEGQYVLAPASAIWLFLFSLFFEFNTMWKNGAFTIIANNIPLFLAASFMGIGVNYLSYLVIQVTSSLTMKILGTARNILVIIIGVLFYGEVVTFHEGVGYTVALAGFAAYNAAKAGFFETFQLSTYLPFLAPSTVRSANGVTVDTKDYDKLELDVEESPGPSAHGYGVKSIAEMKQV